MRKLLALALAWALCLASPVMAQSVTPAPASSLTWRMYLTGNQTGVANNAYTLVAFDAETFDGSNVCATTVTPGRCVPNKPGKYRVSGTYWAGGTITTPQTGTYCAIYKNGALFSQAVVPNPSVAAASFTCTDTVDVNGTTDYIEIFTRIGVTGTATIVGGTTEAFFSGQWVGP